MFGVCFSFSDSDITSIRNDNCEGTGSFCFLKLDDNNGNNIFNVSIPKSSFMPGPIQGAVLYKVSVKLGTMETCVSS